MAGVRVIIEPRARPDPKALELFQMRSVWCGSYTHMRLEAYYGGEKPKDTDTTIFERLARAYAGGHRDEAIFLAASIAARNLPRATAEELRRGNLLYAARNQAEADMLEVGLRAALSVAHGADESPRLGPDEERSYHTLLATLSPNSRIHVISASATPPSFANSFSLDPTQLLSSDPPLGVIPNNLSLCYAASALTLILSLPQVGRALSSARNHSLATGALRLYTQYLKTGGLSDEEARELNTCLVQIPEFSRFGHGEADDSKPFAEEIIGVLRRGNLGLNEIFGKGIYSIPSMVQIKDPSQQTSKAPATELPFTISKRTLAPGGYELIYENRPCLTSSLPLHTKGGVYADREGRLLGSFSEVVEKSLSGDRPDLLVIDHSIGGKEPPGRFSIPGLVELGDSTRYSIHGASMFDQHVTGGHYTTMIISHTTMYVYDPQYSPHSEDMRIYRPRLLLYVKVPG